MDTTNYWPFAQEYSVWNAAVAALLFLMADLNQTTLSDVIERVYTAFFCSDSAQHLRYISEEILFSCFMTILNDTFKCELAQEDEGYESGSESLNIPTPLHHALQLHHVSAQENLSFWKLVLQTPKTHPSPGSLNTVCHHLPLKEDEESSLNRDTTHPRMEHHLPDETTMAHPLTSIEEDDEEEEDAEEHFPT